MPEFLTDPNIAYVLMLLGFYGLLFELTSPGAVLPGIIGGICLGLALYSFHALKVNNTGFLLIVLAIALFVIEIKTVTHGFLIICGLASMLMGSLMLFDGPGSSGRLSLWVILPAMVITAVFFAIVLGLVLKAHRRRPLTGAEGLIGLDGTVTKDITDDEGMVSLHGELWAAYADVPLVKGDKVVVETVSGLHLKVRKKTDN